MYIISYLLTYRTKKPSLYRFSKAKKKGSFFCTTVILGLVVIPGGLESIMKTICIIKTLIMEFQWKSQIFIHMEL